jgi:hypothetical protein
MPYVDNAVRLFLTIMLFYHRHAAMMFGSLLSELFYQLITALS